MGFSTSQTSFAFVLTYSLCALFIITLIHIGTFYETAKHFKASNHCVSYLKWVA